MDNPRASVAFSVLIIAIAVALVGLSWINSKIVSSSPSGESFLTYWVSTRSLLKSSAQPYQSDVLNQIQQETEKRALTTVVQKEWLAFPVYLQAFVLPFALTHDYPIAQIAWMTLLEVCALLLVWISAHTVGWRGNLYLWPVLFLFSLFWFFNVRTFLTGNISILVSLLVALAFWAIKSDIDELGGIFLALATIQPGAVVLLILYTLFWSASFRRWRLFVWLLGGILLLVGVTSLFAPDWIVQYVRYLFQAYPSPEILTPQAVFVIRYPGLGNRLGLALSLITGIVLLVEWWLARGKDFRWYFWTACLTLALTPWIGIPLHQEMYAILLIPLVLVFASLEEAWGARIRWLVFALMGLILVGFWIPYLSDLSQVFVTGRPVFMFTLPALVFAGLYWVRWRATRPRKLLISELKAREI